MFIWSWITLKIGTKSKYAVNTFERGGFNLKLVSNYILKISITSASKSGLKNIR